MTKQDAINLLTQKDQLQLLSFYDTLTPEQQENLLAQIEGIDWSLLDVLKTHETVNCTRHICTAVCHGAVPD